MKYPSALIVTVGIFHDIENGDMDFVPEGIEFYCFVELSAAPGDDENFKRYSNRINWWYDKGNLSIDWS